jgi:hypothetical protein
MNTSEDQFRELLAHLIARTNKLLSQRGQAFPLGLVLNASGGVEVSIATCEEPDQSGDVLNALQSSMVTRAAAGSAIASCISVPDRSGKCVVAFLENHENYCAKVSIPIVRDALSLDTENMVVDDGSTLVFPVVSS